MFTSRVAGGIILARSYGGNEAPIEQGQNYRTHLRLIFGDAWAD